MLCLLVFNQIFSTLFAGLADSDISDLCSECSEISYISDIEEDIRSINFDISNGSPININNFKVAHYNINSILAPDRIEQLTDVCRTLQINVLILSESKLDQNIPNNLITIPGYHEPLRHDRPSNGRHGGGVLMYIANNLAFQHKIEFQKNSYEHLWADIRVNDSIIAINAIYRPPNETAEDHKHFLETTESILQQLSVYNKADYKVFSGDLNYGNIYCKHPILDPKPLDTTAPDLFSSYGFNQLIDIPTRVTENTVSLIDLIYVNKIDDIVCHGTLHKIADHDGVMVCFDIVCKKQKTKTKTIYDYSKADFHGLVQFIKNYDFENTVFCRPIKDQTDIYTEILKEGFLKFVPQKTITLRDSDAPWCNSYTRLLLRKKNRNYKIFKKYETSYLKLINSDNPRPETVTCYLNRKNKAYEKARQSANDSLKANRRNKIAYGNTINSVMNNPSISAKKKFSILLKLMKNDKYSCTPPLVENENVVNDPYQKSNILNKYFTSKSTVPNNDDPIPNLEQYIGVPNLTLLNTSPLEVAKLIRTMKKSNFSHCGIPGKILSEIATPVSFSLSRLFNNLFEIGFFPEIWKLAHSCS